MHDFGRYETLTPTYYFLSLFNGMVCRGRYHRFILHYYLCNGNYNLDYIIYWNWNFLIPLGHYMGYISETLYFFPSYILYLSLSL